MPGPLRLSDYVRRRMAQRRISEGEIIEALATPTTTYTSSSRDDRTVVLGETSSGRRLKIVVLTADPGVIVTVADRDNDD